MTITENYGPNKEKYPYVMMVKGAPEKIISICSHIYKNERIEAFEELDKNKLEVIIEELSKRGERILAFAQLELPI